MQLGGELLDEMVVKWRDSERRGFHVGFTGDLLGEEEAGDYLVDSALDGELGGGNGGAEIAVDVVGAAKGDGKGHPCEVGLFGGCRVP
jgi:hypothetical protein